MASLNVLFEGVEVGSSNALVMCMVTQFLGDWKWHADIFLHIVFIRKNLSPILFVCMTACLASYYVMFETFFLLGMDAAANLLQIESPLPCLPNAEDQLLASSKLPGTSASARPAKFFGASSKNKQFHWKKCFAWLLCSNAVTKAVLCKKER